MTRTREARVKVQQETQLLQIDADADDVKIHQRRTRRGDRGATLTELLVAITLMAVVVVPLINAVSTAISASSASRSAANVETALVNAADRINRAPSRCSYTMYAQAAVQTQGWNANNAKVQHSYYLPGPDATTPGSWQNDTDACPGAAPTDLLVQRMVVSITSPDGRVTRTIEVIKSDI